MQFGQSPPFQSCLSAGPCAFPRPDICRYYLLFLSVLTANSQYKSLVQGNTLVLLPCTSHTKGDQSSVAFSSCTPVVSGGCRRDIDLQSSHRILCCAKCNTGICTIGRSVRRNRRMNGRRGHSPSIHGSRRLRGAGEADRKLVRISKEQRSRKMVDNEEVPAEGASV